MRIDKFLAHTIGQSRSEVKKFLKQKGVKVDGIVVTSPSLQVDVDSQVVTVFDDVIEYREFVYLMMNKPQGYLSATSDGRDSTVLDLIDGYYLGFDLSIAGRLDKATEGLVVLTNDGGLIHDVITPKNAIYKRYVARITGELTSKGVSMLETGVEILDGKGVVYKTKPARVEVLGADEVLIEICEGKFHQVRRMFAHVGCEVVFLKRLSIGGLMLDEGLELGEYRELSDAEVRLLVGG